MSCDICYYSIEYQKNPDLLTCVILGEQVRREFICGEFSRSNQNYFKKLEQENKELVRKVQLLKELMLLTHEQVNHEQTGELQTRQWNEFIAQFPDEA